MNQQSMRLTPQSKNSSRGPKPFAQPDPLRHAATVRLAQTLSRRAKLGISCRVKVPVGQGLATHPYRVLGPGRSRREAANKTGLA